MVGEMPYFMNGDDLVRNGAKLLQVVHGNITFIDSLSFFAMPLSNFPKTFGLHELKKGFFFTHLFNTPKHQTYVGPIPEKKYFMPEVMSSSKRKEFDTWYATQPSTGYDFHKELPEYCESDVKLWTSIGLMCGPKTIHKLCDRLHVDILTRWYIGNRVYNRVFNL